jgi:hypothetical protein
LGQLDNFYQILELWVFNDTKRESGGCNKLEKLLKKDILAEYLAG